MWVDQRVFYGNYNIIKWLVYSGKRCECQINRVVYKHWTGLLELWNSGMFNSFYLVTPTYLECAHAIVWLMSWMLKSDCGYLVYESMKNTLNCDTV